jgi:uncharacterized repeat protein (TIGR01451 family)
MSRLRPTRRKLVPTLTVLEDRSVPAAFAPGSIQGQDGWSGGALPVSPLVTQTVDLGATVGRTGAGAFVLSNSTANGDYNAAGAFAGWPFSPGLSAAAGQPSSGAPASVFSSTVWFRSVSSTADGSNVEIDLGFSDGSNRNSYVAVINRADAQGGLQLETTEPAGGGAFFAPTVQVSNLARGVWHRLDVTATFRDGVANDTYMLYLNGNLIRNVDTGGDSFETFERYYDDIGAAYRTTNRLLFRSGARPSEIGAFADNAAQGFAFDDVSYYSATAAAPTTPLAYYFSAFEAKPSVVYVNSTFPAAGPIADADPNTPGAQPATAGVDAFNDTAAALANLADGGQLFVFGGGYSGGVAPTATTVHVGGMNGTAVVTTGDLQLPSGSVIEMEVNGPTPGTGHDQLVGTGNLNIGGAVLNLTARNAPVPAARYTVIQTSGAVSGQFANLPEGAVVNYGGFQYRMRYTTNAVFLELDRGDLSITITDNAASVAFGGLTTYTIVVRNTGPRTATGAVVNVQLPTALTGATFTSVAAGGATGNSATGGGAPSDTLTLPSGATVTYTVTGQVLGSAGLPMTAIANIVVPTLSLFDPLLSNNSAADSTFVIPPDTTRATPRVIAGGSLTAGQIVGLAVVFDEPVLGFSVGDLLVTNATVVGFSGSGQVYNLILIPTAAGEVRITVLDGAAVDAAGNPSLPTVAVFSAAPAPAPITPIPPVPPVPPPPPPPPVRQQERFATAVGGLVTLHDLTNGAVGSFVPFPGFPGTVTVATGDLNGDGIPELVVGAGPGGAPHVKVFDGAMGAELASFYAFAESFPGGVNVAAGGGQLVVGAGAGGAPHVRAFALTGGGLTETHSFYAYAESFTGGVRVAVGDVNNDGRPDIVTGAGAGGAPHVKAFDMPSMAEVASFYAFDIGFTGGVYVAARTGQIVVGQGNGGRQVKVFNAGGGELTAFNAFAAPFSSGVRVGVADLNRDGIPDLVAGAGPGSAPIVRAFSLDTLAEATGFLAGNAGNQSGVFVG